MRVTSPAAIDRAAPLTAALTVRATVLWGSANRRVLVFTAGAPPLHGVLAVDATGTNEVAVRVLKGRHACTSAPIARTGLGTSRWCLQIDGIAPGQQYQGVLRGSSTALTLTLTARHDWWFLPLLTALGGLLVALGLLWLTTHFLPDRLTGREPENAMADNDGIDGLGGWPAEAKGRLAEADVLARLRWAKRYGKARAVQARDQLSVLVAASETVVVDSTVVVLAAVPMLIAASSVLAVWYLPNQTFGTWTDYLALAVSALGSSSVVGVLALLFLLRGPQASYG